MDIFSLGVVIGLFFLLRWYERDTDSRKLLRENYSEWFEAANHAARIIANEQCVKLANQANAEGILSREQHENIFEATNETAKATATLGAHNTKLRLVDGNSERGEMVEAACQGLLDMRKTKGSEPGSSSDLANLLRQPIAHLIKSGDAGPTPLMPVPKFISKHFTRDSKQ